LANILIDLEWFRCPKGYRLISSRSMVPVGCSPSFYPDEDWIVPTTSEHVPCRPLEVDNLYNIFANIRSRASLLEFTKEFGTLTRLASTSWGESVPTCLQQAKIFRELLQYHQKSRGMLASRFASLPGVYSQELGSVNVVQDPVIGLRLTITSETLLTALWLQLGQKLSGDAEIRKCRHCSQFFEAGPGTGKHVDAEFCCNEHKIRYFSLARSRRKREVN
jgi:hypothetical protein